MRKINEIAYDIKKNWKKVSVHAAPYLEAMFFLSSIDENYGYDSGREVVSRFLCNASSFRGPEARRIKSELREMLK